MWQNFLAHDPKEKDGSYAEKTSMSIARPDGSVGTVVSSSEEKRVKDTARKSTATHMEEYRRLRQRI